MHGTRNRRTYRHCKKPPDDRPLSEEEIRAARSRIFRQHIAYLMRKIGFFNKARSDAEIAAERHRVTVEYLQHVERVMMKRAVAKLRNDARCKR